MSNKTKDTEQKQPSIMDELLKNGTVVITSPTREGFEPMLKEIPTEVKYAAGAVGYDYEHGIYSLRLDIFKE